MATAEKPKSVEPTDPTIEFVPFMSQDSIKLSISIVKNMLCVPTKRGEVCSDKEALKFMMLCRARQLNPFEGDAFLIGYQPKEGPPTFSLITAHQAFLKRAETHPEYDGMESGIIVSTKEGDVVDRVGDFQFKGDELLGGWAIVHFKNRSHPMVKRLNLATFDKGFGQWNVNPAGMICKVSEADALRSSFPTMLGGMYLQDEMLDGIGAEHRAREPQKRVAFSPLNNSFTMPAAAREKETVPKNGHTEHTAEMTVEEAAGFDLPAFLANLRADLARQNEKRDIATTVKNAKAALPEGHRDEGTFAEIDMAGDERRKELLEPKQGTLMDTHSQVGQ